MKRTLQASLNNLIKHNKEGSFSTHANRSARLNQSVEQISEKYTGLNNVRELKTKHVDYLVERWKSEGLSAGTIKNRMTDLRWISRKIDKPNIVKRTNDEYGIERRVYTDNDKNIAKTLDDKELERVSDPYTKLSLQLQQEFGLRRSESIKFDPKYADQGDHLKLKSSWCKGGRPREVLVRNERQRELLNEVREFCREQKSQALIPSEKNYSQQLSVYEKQCSRNGINKNHGLRHYYAQDRYKELTGWECPKNGGKVAKNMTAEERAIDKQARLQISSELGHNREGVTNSYLGGKR